MNIILSVLSAILGAVFRGSKILKNTEKKDSFKVDTSSSNEVMNNARASVIWLCVAILAAVWIPQYLFADYLWIKDCIIHNQLLPFPLDDKKLFDLLYSF